MNLQDFSLIFMGILILIILYILIGKYLEHKHIHIIHETGIGILIGLIFGLFLYLTKNIKSINFNQQIFFYGLLPPMIFAGGYNLKKQDFQKNFKYIFIFGFLGTIVAFGTIFGLTLLIDNLDWIIPIGQDKQYEVMNIALIVKYSATISATDSVAALTLINPAKYPKLFSIIFGQGMVNDAVAIILFKVVGDIVAEATTTTDEVNGGQIALEILWKFLLTVFASLGIGAGCGLICSFIFKNCRFLVHSQVTQVVITYLFGILSYVIAQFLDMSGVITVLVCGVVLAHYNFYNLTPGGMHATTVCFQFIAFLAQAIVFAYLGISIIYYFIQQTFSITFIAAQLVICILARFVSIFGLTVLFRLFTKWKVPTNELAVVCSAGSIRGSVALALILTIESDHETKQQVQIVKSTVLIMVCITTIVLGGLMPKCISYFMTPKTDLTQSALEHQQSQTKKEKQDNQERKIKKQKGIMSKIQNKYLKKWFIYDYANNKQNYKMYKKVIKSNNLDEAFKQQNKQFILKDLKLIQYSSESQNEPINKSESIRNNRIKQSSKESLMSSGIQS